MFLSTVHQRLSPLRINQTKSLGAVSSESLEMKRHVIFIHSVARFNSQTASFLPGFTRNPRRGQEVGVYEHELGQLCAILGWCWVNIAVATPWMYWGRLFSRALFCRPQPRLKPVLRTTLIRTSSTFERVVSGASTQSWIGCMDKFVNDRLYGAIKEQNIVDKTTPDNCQGGWASASAWRRASINSKICPLQFSPASSTTRPQRSRFELRTHSQKEGRVTCMYTCCPSRR